MFLDHLGNLDKTELDLVGLGMDQDAAFLTSSRVILMWLLYKQNFEEQGPKSLPILCVRRGTTNYHYYKLFRNADSIARLSGFKSKIFLLPSIDLGKLSTSLPLSFLMLS